MAEGDHDHPIQFGDGAPTRGFTELWPDAIRRYFTTYREAYRSWLKDYFPTELDRWPEAFPLATPVEALIVGTLAAFWIFIRPAVQDSIQVREAWQHETFADWSFLRMPLEHRMEAVGRAFLSSPGWLLLEEQELAGVLVNEATPQFYRTEEYAHARAEHDVQAGRERDSARDGDLDQVALVQVRTDLEALERSHNEQNRGRQFEAAIERLLIAHGCEVERGRQARSEQVDLFMIEPQVALIECRWEAEPLQPKVIRDILGKLRKRPAGVVGMYVSMSGFTQGAVTEAEDAARDRTIVLIAREDVMRLALGDIKFRALWRERIRELILRY